MYKIAIAGYRHGHIGELFSKCQGTAQIVACCNASPDFAESLRAHRPEVKILDCSVEQMLQDVECDIVAMGDAYGRRGTNALTALKYGRHVIADKPLCISFEELSEIRQRSAEQNLTVGFMLPLWSTANAMTAKKMIAAGELGEIQGVNFTGHHPLNYGTRPSWYWEKGLHGGTINDIAPHGIDLIEFVTGMKFGEPVAARTWNQAFPEVPHFNNGAQFITKLENGAGVTADVSYFAPRFSLPVYWQFNFWGTKGWLSFNHEDGLLFANKEEAAHAVTLEAEGVDYWHCFIDEIEGRKHPYFNKEHIFEVTETTLNIQRLADSSKA